MGLLLNIHGKPWDLATSSLHFVSPKVIFMAMPTAAYKAMFVHLELLF